MESMILNHLIKGILAIVRLIMVALATLLGSFNAAKGPTPSLGMGSGSRATLAMANFSSRTESHGQDPSFPADPSSGR